MLIDPHCITFYTPRRTCLLTNPVILLSAIYLLYSEENMFIDPTVIFFSAILPLVLQEKHVY